MLDDKACLEQDALENKDQLSQAHRELAFRKQILETRAETLVGSAAEPGRDAAEWEQLMDDLKTLMKETKGEVACAVARTEDLMEITGVEQADYETFRVRELQWIRDIVNKLVQLEGRM